mmetsp:Transcript_11233/g.22721  ORF Transcript_11233/g.22721 Transcript_11233/m.22721 type:complete len:225 (-) Transcript_11233:35-709(-)
MLHPPPSSHQTASLCGTPSYSDCTPSCTTYQMDQRQVPPLAHSTSIYSIAKRVASSSPTSYHYGRLSSSVRPYTHSSTSYLYVWLLRHSPSPTCLPSPPPSPLYPRASHPISLHPSSRHPRRTASSHSDLLWNDLTSPPSSSASFVAQASQRHAHSPSHHSTMLSSQLPPSQKPLGRYSMHYYRSQPLPTATSFSMRPPPSTWRPSPHPARLRTRPLTHGYVLI